MSALRYDSQLVYLRAYTGWPGPLGYAVKFTLYLLCILFLVCFEFFDEAFCMGITDKIGYAITQTWLSQLVKGPTVFCWSVWIHMTKVTVTLTSYICSIYTDTVTGYWSVTGFFEPYTIVVFYHLKCIQFLLNEGCSVSSCNTVIFICSFLTHGGMGYILYINI